jgi:hypothetical protein
MPFVVGGLRRRLALVLHLNSRTPPSAFAVRESTGMGVLDSGEAVGDGAAMQGTLDARRTSMKFRFACVLSVLALALAVTSTAQTDASRYSGPTAAVSGKVVSSSSASLVIETDAGTRQTFVVDSASSVPSNLSAGSRVTVNFHTADAGFHAATVTLADMPSPGQVPPAAPMAGDRPMPATASDGPLLLIGGLVALAMALALHGATRYFSHS